VDRAVRLVGDVDGGLDVLVQEDFAAGVESAELRPGLRERRSSRASSETAKPSRSRRRAIARPMPFAPPVTGRAVTSQR
jgi:hypothetical protein